MSRDAPAHETTIGGYRLAGLIGKGAIGEVHAALAADGQPVAIKLVSLAQAADDTRGASRQRFLAEAGAAQRLQHPDIVRVLAAGEHNGTAWMAMELLAGCDLVRYTRPARLLPEAVVVQIGERLARALAYAHASGVVHRDVKPANVVVHWPSDRVTLTDFGLARLADAERTRTGLVLGSPVYMAPELLAGAVPDARSDLYALGVTLFQLLAGRLPHDSASMGELLRQVATQPAPDLCVLQPSLPRALGQAVAALLAKRPEHRPPDAASLAELLRPLRQQLQAGMPARDAGPKSRA